MGYIASLTNGDKAKRVPTQSESGESLWRQAFGGTHKEEASRKPLTHRSVVATDLAVKKLLQAMRSMAPGGWTDDRWEQSKHFVGIAYVAIHRQNELLTQSEYQVSWKDTSHPDGKVPVKETDGDAYRLVELLQNPNDDDGFGDIIAQWNLQMDLTGTALTWMVPNALGTPMELYPIPTSIAIPQPAVNPDYPDGYYRIQPVYPYGPFSSYPTPASAVGAAIPSQWMIRVKYPHPWLRYEGYSPLTALRLHLDEVEMIDRSRHSSMRRGINPSAVMNSDGGKDTIPQPLPEEEIQRIRAQFESDHMGPENSGRLLVATPGYNLEPWGMPPSDMAYQEGWDQLVAFALSGLGITKSAAGMIDDANYATLFGSLKQLYWLTLEPKVTRLGRALTKHLAPFFGDGLIVEIRCRRIDDHEVKLAKLTSAMEGKAITKNELRKELELPLTMEAWGADIAGDPSPAEQEQMAADMEMQAEMMAAQPPNLPPEEGGEDPMVEDSRPLPQQNGASNLKVKKKLLVAAGGKSLNGNGHMSLPPREKSYLERVMKVTRNGH